jgi:recombination protein RecT
MNARNNSLARRPGEIQNPVSAIKAMTNDPKMISRFKEVIGQKAPQFLASVVSAVRTNPELQKASPESVMASAMIAATLNLDINPSLGFAALVPYKRNKKTDGGWSSTVEAQFQVMTKGFVQLALRSGQYRNINVTEIYEDEYQGEDIITGEVQIQPVGDGDRAHGRTSQIVGYVAYMEFINGFRKTVYWTMDKILQHAQKFSKSYDKKTGSFYKGSAWDSHFEAMCRKTVLKNALSSWGILSTQMQDALVSDEAYKHDMSSEVEYPQENEQQIEEVNRHHQIPNNATARQETSNKDSSEDAFDISPDYDDYDMNEADMVDSLFAQ